MALVMSKTRACRCLLRDSQVLPIWEGTTNVLALDTLRALQSGDGDLKTGLARFGSAVMRCFENVSDERLAEASRVARSALDHATNWLTEAKRAGQPALEAGARRFSLTLGRIMEIALLIQACAVVKGSNTMIVELVPPPVVLRTQASTSSAIMIWMM